MLARGGQESVDILLADAPVGVEELALDRDEAAIVQGSDQIDPGIGAVEFATARPVGPEIDVRKALRLCRIGDEPRGDQLLERGALVAFS